MKLKETPLSTEIITYSNLLSSGIETDLSNLSSDSKVPTAKLLSSYLDTIPSQIGNYEISGSSMISTTKKKLSDLKLQKLRLTFTNISETKEIYCFDATEL